MSREPPRVGAVASLSPPHLCALFVLGTLLVGGLWTRLDRTPIATAVLLAVLLGLAWMGRRGPAALAVAPHRPMTGLGRGLVIGAVVMAPMIVCLMATWRQEFPFLGDHDFHLFAQEASWAFWPPKLVAVVALVGATAVAYRGSWLAWWIPTAFALLLAWSWFVDLPWFYARYPGADHFFELPISALGHLTGWESPLNIGRLHHVLVVGAWLFVLRPLVIGRWPDPELLPFGLFYFWQKDVVYFFSSAYLEPTAVILVLLAAEYLLTTDGPRAVTACLLVGAAAMVKEQAILLLPFFWLAARPWRADASGRRDAAVIGIGSALPFCYYLVVRGQMQVSRTAELAGAADVFPAQRAAAFAERVWVQFHVPGLVVVAIAAAALLSECLARRRSSFVVAVLAASGLVHVGFFYVDRHSAWWTGYPRFHLFALAMLGLGLLTLGYRWRADGRSRRLAMLVAVVGALNASVVIGEIRAALDRPDSYRSFTEHVDAPYFQPIRAIVRSAVQAGAMSDVHTLVLADRIGTHAASIWGAAYPDLARRYRLETASSSDPISAPACACRAEGEARIVPFKVFTGLAADDDAGRRREDGVRHQCLAEMTRTCRTVVEDRSGGTLIGALGVGRR